MMYATHAPGPLDCATAVAMPLAAVPLDSEFQPLDAPGRRILCAQDGLYVEARSHVLYVRQRISKCVLPYGPLQPEVRLLHGRLPRDFYESLVSRSIRAFPKEMAALIALDDGQGGSGYVLWEPNGSGTVGAVTYDDSTHDESMLVVDAHSHGPYEARFSVTDDASDQSRIGPHISLVFGQCESRSTAHVAARVCVGRYLIPLSHHAVQELFA